MLRVTRRVRVFACVFSRAVCVCSRAACVCAQWNFKTIPPSEWSYLDGLRYGFMPPAHQAATDGRRLCPVDPGPLPEYCTAKDPACDLCLAREGRNATCKPWPPVPPPPPADPTLGCAESAAPTLSTLLLLPRDATQPLGVGAPLLAPGPASAPDGPPPVPLALIGAAPLALLALGLASWLAARTSARQAAAVQRTRPKVDDTADFYVAF